MPSIPVFFASVRLTGCKLEQRNGVPNTDNALVLTRKSCKAIIVVLTLAAHWEVAEEECIHLRRDSVRPRLSFPCRIHAAQWHTEVHRARPLRRNPARRLRTRLTTEIASEVLISGIERFLSKAD